MNRFTFSCWDAEDNRTTTVEVDATNMDIVIETFEEFLRGCGYCFDGQIIRYEDAPRQVMVTRSSLVYKDIDGNIIVS